MSAARWFQSDLVPYGDVAAGLSLWAGVRRAGDRLFVRYELQGALAEVCLPAPTPTPARRDGLWQHTCFEAFVAPQGSAGYRELNLSPSGDWACYRFSQYRAGQADEPLVPPPAIIGSQPNTDIFTLEAEVTLVGLATEPTLEVGLTAVIELRGGDKTYWALAHRGPKPDFHLRDSFTLRIE